MKDVLATAELGEAVCMLCEGLGYEELPHFDFESLKPLRHRCPGCEGTGMIKTVSITLEKAQSRLPGRR